MAQPQLIRPWPFACERTLWPMPGLLPLYGCAMRLGRSVGQPQTSSGLRAYIGPDSEFCGHPSPSSLSVAPSGARRPLFCLLMVPHSDVSGPPTRRHLHLVNTNFFAILFSSVATRQRSTARCYFKAPTLLSISNCRHSTKMWRKSSDWALNPGN
jgi:hypothetical protein